MKMADIDLPTSGQFDQPANPPAPLSTTPSLGIYVSALDGVRGLVGVDLLFVLSGFLITRILLDFKQKPHYVRNFYGMPTRRVS
jgi:peptidoglycan/LPS O-acetylase OafA/YrhL